mmetsp:Transcript_11364/g.25737  ORF Transcript_11364/g.25737 Transcript_11364/m.25737 type:complete len:352 (-) Transcript_11364:15-1070(-)
MQDAGELDFFGTLQLGPFEGNDTVPDQFTGSAHGLVGSKCDAVGISFPPFLIEIVGFAAPRVARSCFGDNVVVLGVVSNNGGATNGHIPDALVSEKGSGIVFFGVFESPPRDTGRFLFRELVDGPQRRQAPNAIARSNLVAVVVVRRPDAVRHGGPGQPSTGTVTQHQHRLLFVPLLLFVRRVHGFLDALHVPPVSESRRLGGAQVKIRNVQQTSRDADPVASFHRNRVDLGFIESPTRKDGFQSDLRGLVEGCVVIDAVVAETRANDDRTKGSGRRNNRAHRQQHQERKNRSVVDSLKHRLCCFLGLQLSYQTRIVRDRLRKAGRSSRERNSNTTTTNYCRMYFFLQPRK